ncbi:cyclic nucleotide-binding protein [Chloroherpeton thalassium ATCC 35110]|uniref:Cyclic nucleotide-binding protein n=1 Tax=Chloroherpeton thalassium (strain ATCC 35110 / GB-78) TaxID=517418 RepID=B3QTS6_CHLT3|nr:cation:proton antiporter [Chloroherpeton thalassium]ACF14274.1 cyclic nucleotide-binding protein [Chloroherpeton thalassium ATCC 35110]
MEHGAEVAHQAAEHAVSSGQLGLLFLIVSLVIGAATRYFLRKTKLPYTVALLLIGLGLGVAERNHLLVGEGVLGQFGTAINMASTIDPHFILFVFLPTLIFEAAFGMDVHVFKRSITNVILLAVPGLLLSTAILGGISMLFPYNWNWSVALMFGALLSATDPVAVVALLKELGASKKLATLIEGESLLNDGTAIVVFMVFLSAVTAVGGDSGFMSVLANFSWVAFGGTILGLIIAGLTIWWLRHVFNDALVEITLTVAAAYLTFYVSESFLHVSGVLALVALGLLLAGIGRTRISPEVEAFLHNFWEMTAYFANTLIFILVGVVIAEQAQAGSVHDWLLLGVLYLGIHVARAIVIGALYPMMRHSGYGLPKNEAIVLWWGGLRGAVGLALGLLVSQNALIPEEIRGQILFHTAGIVVLTLLINGTTTGTLIKMLGMQKVTAAKALLLDNAIKVLREDTEQTFLLLKDNKFLSGADWERVREYMPRRKTPKEKGEVSEVKEMDILTESRRRILEAQKRSYWRQFEEGVLGQGAVRRLTEAVNIALDRDDEGSLDDWKELEHLWQFPAILTKLQSFPVIGKMVRRTLYDRLAFGYDIARGYVVAHEEISETLESIIHDDAVAMNLQVEMNYNRGIALGAIKKLRETFPEITMAIETKTAARLILNHERNSIKKMYEGGMLNEIEKERLVAAVERRMKRIFNTPPSIELPDSREVLKQISWLNGIDESAFKKIWEAAKEEMITQGTQLIAKGETGDHLIIVVRGTVRVIYGKDLSDILGPGSTLGELAFLTAGTHVATAQAETTVQILKIAAQDLRKLIHEIPVIGEKLWHLAGMHAAESILRPQEPYRFWGQVRLKRWLLGGKVTAPPTGRLQQVKDTVVLLSGKAALQENGVQVQEIRPISILKNAAVAFEEDAHVFLCPPLKMEAHDMRSAQNLNADIS